MATQMKKHNTARELREFVKKYNQLATAVIKEFPQAIRYVQNPTTAQRKMAVKKQGISIRFIENPSEDEQFLAVNQNWLAIKYIKNPSEAVQLASVTRNSEAIRYISNPSEAVLLAAVSRKGQVIKYITAPSEAVQLAAVQDFWHNISYILHPTEAAQLTAAEWILNYQERVMRNNSMSYCLRNLIKKNPQPTIKEFVIRHNKCGIKYIPKELRTPEDIMLYKMIWG